MSKQKKCKKCMVCGEEFAEFFVFTDPDTNIDYCEGCEESGELDRHIKKMKEEIKLGKEIDRGMEEEEYKKADRFELNANDLTYLEEGY